MLEGKEVEVSSRARHLHQDPPYMARQQHNPITKNAKKKMKDENRQSNKTNNQKKRTQGRETSVWKEDSIVTGGPRKYRYKYKYKYSHKYNYRYKKYRYKFRKEIPL